MQEIVIAVLILVLIVLFYVYYSKSKASSTSKEGFRFDDPSRHQSHERIVRKNPNNVHNKVPRKLTVEEKFMNEQTEWSTGMQEKRIENFSVEQMNSPTMYHNQTTDTDYDEVVQSTIDQKTRDNHRQWASTSGAKIHNAVPRKVDDLEIGNYVPWLGLRRPQAIPLSEERLLITELGPEDFADNTVKCFF